MRPLALFCTLTGVLFTAPLPAQTPAAKRSKPGSIFWTSKAAGVTYRWTEKDLTATVGAAGTPSYSVARALKKEFGKPEADNGYSSYEVSFQPLSAIGTLLSYERDDYWDGGAHPSGNESFVTLDVHDPKHPLKVTDLFNAAEIRQALLSDPIVQRILTRDKIAPPPTLNGLVKALAIKEFGGEEDCKYSFPENLLSDFAFHHIENGKVAVRFLLPHGAEIYRFQNTQLGILLPIPAKWKTAFTQAANGSAGAMMASLQKVGKDKKSSVVLQGHPE